MRQFGYPPDQGKVAEYIRFLGTAAGSAGELETQYRPAGGLAYLEEDSGEALLTLHAGVARTLDAPIRGLSAQADQRAWAQAPFDP